MTIDYETRKAEVAWDALGRASRAIEAGRYGDAALHAAGAAHVLGELRAVLATQAANAPKPKDETHG